MPPPQNTAQAPGAGPDHDADGAAGGAGVRHPRWTVAATMLASSLAFIDGSVTNVALPTIDHSLGGSATSLPWVINAYLLPLSALLLLGGALGDRFGRRRVLVLGIGLFAAASLGCAAAPSLGWLLVSRTLQGVGAAILMPNSLGILGASFTGAARGRAVGTWAAAGAISSAIGPTLGGWLVETVGWRAIFFVNLPVAAAAIGVAWRWVAESDAGQSRLDGWGAGLATGALGLLTWALTQWSGTHAATPAVGAGLVAGAALAGLFVWHERRLGEAAMMPLALFASRAFIGLTGLTLLLYGALGGLIVLLPFVLITAAHYTTVQAGLSLLPFSLVMGVASRFSGPLVARVGPRLPLTVGPIVTGVGFLAMTRFEPTGSYVGGVLPGMALIALGMAGTAAPLTTTVLSSVDGRHTGTASGFNSAVARTGGLVATALGGAVFATPAAGLAGAFHAAAVVGSVLAVASGLIAFATLAGRDRPEHG